MQDALTRLKIASYIVTKLFLSSAQLKKKV